jgi:hypothetical protein
MKKPELDKSDIEGCVDHVVFVIGSAIPITAENKKAIRRIVAAAIHCAFHEANGWL